MKMLHIVCGKKFEDEIIAMFKDLGLNRYTMISGVGGSGVTRDRTGFQLFDQPQYEYAVYGRARI